MIRMRILHWDSLDAESRRAALARPAQGAREDVASAVRDIIAAVRREGDAALKRLTERFDGVRIDELAVSRAEIAAARGRLTSAQLAALERAVANVEAFHAKQRLEPFALEVAPGVR